MKARIRSAIAADLEKLQAIARHTIDAGYRAFIDDEEVDWFLSGPSDEYLCRNIEHATVMTVDDDLVGLAVCKANVIDLLIIDHGSHRRGFGTALLAHCESDLFQRYDEITLESFEGNGNANRFYRKNGWTRKGAVSDAMSGRRKWILRKKRKI